MKLKTFFITAMAVVTMSQVACAEEAKPSGLIEGQDYSVIKGVKASKKPQVVEVFSYHCGHCFSTEAFVEEWLKTKPEEIAFKQVPLYIPSAEHLTRAYYVGELLKVLDKTHMAIFKTWHTDKKILRNKEDLIPIFEKAGVSKEDFLKAYDSFAVESKVQYAKKVMRDLKVQGVPFFVVNNKYQIERNKNFMNYKLLNELPIEKNK